LPLASPYSFLFLAEHTKTQRPEKTDY